MKKMSASAGTLTKHTLLYRTGSVFLKMGKYLSRRNTIVEIICALLIILFIYTGLNKMIDIDKFKFEMGRSPFIQNINEFIAYTVPTGEMLLALLLIIKRTRLLGLYLSFALMALFTGYIWLMLNYSYDLPCSCGGILEKMSWKDHLFFNVGFTILSLIGITIQTKVKSKRSENIIV
jgi:uncharacterized membrane protein YphA (DoxX/SURF4 family)